MALPLCGTTGIACHLGAAILFVWASSSLVDAWQVPAFRSATDIVPLHATVRGPDGRLVTNLEQADFQLFDNGKRVPIRVFSRDVQPLTVSALVDVSGGFIDSAVFENLRTSLVGLINALGPEDRMRMGSFAYREIGMAAELTGDKAILRRVVAEELWPGAGARPLWNAIGQGIRAVQTEAGKRVVLVLTSGPNTFSLRGQPDFRAVRGSASENDVMVYVVLLASRSGGVGADEAPDDGSSLAAVRGLAAETGGGHVSAPGGQRLADALGTVTDELRHQYALGFTPAAFDGKIHTLDLRVSREGHVARTRTQYVARRRSP